MPISPYTMAQLYDVTIQDGAALWRNMHCVVMFWDEKTAGCTIYSTFKMRPEVFLIKKLIICSLKKEKRFLTIKYEATLGEISNTGS